jgi:hypothetical protein
VTVSKHQIETPKPFSFAAQIFYLGNDIIDYVKHYLRAIAVHLFFSLP